ncbi:MAG: chemotaxis protein CheY [Cyanobium sp. CACIAM 14]|nr:MAG: chemotaxis protein CheY [Cyanobium sp. CACIAM 14]
MRRRPAQSLPQLLLFADPLQRAGIISWLQKDPPCGEVVASDAPGISPQLILWCLGSPPEPQALDAEIRRLLERWNPAPLLLLLPHGHPYGRDLLLQLPAQGLLEPVEEEGVREAVATLLAGGRVLSITPAPRAEVAAPVPPLGLGQWLLLSGLQQIDAELRLCLGLLDPPPDRLLPLLLLQGRVRELRMARRLLLWLWGPIGMAWGAVAPAGPVDEEAADPQGPGGGETVAITLRQRTADGLWEALRHRLAEAAAAGPGNRSGQLLALDGLHPSRRSDLLLGLLEQFEQLRSRLLQDDPRGERLDALWRELQPQLRQQALRQMAGSYVQLPMEGKLSPVAETLLRRSQLEGDDEELPDPMAMLQPLLQARPLLVEGRLLSPDEPQAVLYLELLLSNWLVRNAELISAEVLAACAEWPELRRYLLRPDLLATRNLERLRNQLNAQQRWSSWFERPIHLYESRRPLYRLGPAAIDRVDLTEPRDAELRQLGWVQQAVTLALEARDALAPQLQGLLRRLGDLLVVLLTQVVGKAIGLVGRGIVQGMGRSLHRG